MDFKSKKKKLRNLQNNFKVEKRTNERILRKPATKLLKVKRQQEANPSKRELFGIDNIFACRKNEILGRKTSKDTISLHVVRRNTRCVIAPPRSCSETALESK